MSLIVSPNTRSPRRWRITVTLGVLSLLVFVLAACGATTPPGSNATPTPKPTATVTPPSTTWSVVTSPNPTTYPESGLAAVSAISSTNAWAVGSNYENAGQTNALIEQWNGTSWQVVPGQSENLTGVASISANDVWAVGSQNAGLPEPYQSRTVIEHWNGTAWSIVSSPRLGSQDRLYSVVALASNDVWAVGSTLGTTTRRPLIEHWNGTAWSVVSGPDLQGVTDSALKSVTRIPGTNELWAVGYMIKGVRPQYDQPLIMRWNGHGWMLVTPTTPAGTLSSRLNGVMALSSTDAWAVGTYTPTGSEKMQGLIEHWNGSAWQPVATPTTAAISPSEFYSVAAAGAQDVRTVGRYFVNDEGTARGMIAQWDGSAWSAIASPTPSGVTYSTLNAVTSDGAGHYWAVGFFMSASHHAQTLILHCP